MNKSVSAAAAKALTMGNERSFYFALKTCLRNRKKKKKVKDWLINKKGQTINPIFKLILILH